MEIVRRLHDDVCYGFRKAIPLPRHRRPLTWHTMPHAFGFLVPFLLMGYLARRKDTHLTRLLLLPILLISAIHGTYGYGGSYDEYAFVMCFRGFLGLSAMVLGVDLALAKEGRLKIGESSVPTSSPRIPPLTLPERLLPPWLLDTLEVSLTLRGIGWQFGRHVNVSKEYRPLNRGPFLKATALCFVQNYLVLDICLVTFKVLPGIGEPTGGSLYYSGLRPLFRFPLALFLTLLSMVALVSGMQTCYALATLFGVAILLQSPSQWPPIMDNPFAADSLHDFWSKRWHQALRRTFVVSGGSPGYWIGGRSGFVLGSFLASGLFHEGGTYLVGRGVDHKVTLYFVLQGVGVLLERYCRSITGRRVEGAVGRMWVRMFLIASSQIALDSWFRRGLAGGTIIPPSLSLATGFVLPTLRELSGQYLFVHVH